MTTDVEAEVTAMDKAPARTLNALDRCDRCGAQAYVVTEHERSELVWCKHHFEEHEQLLDPLKVLDERDKINTSASVSA